MRKNSLIKFFLLIIFTLSLIFLFFKLSDKKRISVTIGKAVFKVEVVKTAEEKAKGLAGHKPLTDNEGMLFEFPKGDGYSFWMKGMTFPIDIIWIKNNKVIYFVENAPPPLSGQNEADLPVYSPPIPAEYVLEINAGEVEKYKIRVGDEVKLNHINSYTR